MRDYGEILNSMRICLNVDRDSNCLSECFGCKYITHDHHVMDMVRDAADAIEELVAATPKWISVDERLPERTNPLHARDTYLVRLESGCIKTLFYEYDNSDRCRPGMSPLFSEGWAKTAVPVTHWMPLPAPPKEVLPNGEV